MGEFEQSPWYVTAGVIVLFAPFVETFVMGGAASLLGRVSGPVVAVWASAIGWGILHGTAAPAWGFVVWWAFLILTIVYLTWRPRGFWVAVAMATAVHAMQNAVGALGMYLD